MTPERPKYPAAARKLLNDTLLDSVHHLLQEKPWAQVTMAAIATDAGVSRQTVYNEFGDRDGIAKAYVLREVEWFVSAAEAAVAKHPDDPRGAIAEAFAHFLKAASEHPLMRAIAGDDAADELLQLFTTQGDPVVTAAAGQLAHFLTQSWAQLAARDAQLIADTVVRLAISHAALPSAPPHETANQVAELLGPYLERVLGRGVASAA